MRITITATRFFKMFRLTRRPNYSLTNCSNVWVENMLFDWAIDLALAYVHICRDILVGYFQHNLQLEHYKRRH